MNDYGAIEKLRREHLLDSFDCGKEDLNRLLKRQAWNSPQAHSAQTYVLVKDLRVLGYYSLAAGAVTHEGATERVRKGLAALAKRTRKCPVSITCRTSVVLPTCRGPVTAWTKRRASRSRRLRTAARGLTKLTRLYSI